MKKNMSTGLVMLRDRDTRAYSQQMLDELSDAVKDNNYRLFAQDDQIHLVSRGLHLADADPFALFEQLLGQPISDNVDVGHAFYLGYEMAKASIANLLGKRYEQDQALRWGLLTRDEPSHRLKRTNRHRGKQ